ncbi:MULTISPECIES: UTRA domain-containing protein [unclassified Frankia]|uniref:UTRA domain-containing protein n=1 Tax=unclassified Frankia TaxID=2632575 RepID=UPI002AD529B7|nr:MULTISPECIES: UTRA domain-containing protein [unclassified Frankia]
MAAVGIIEVGHVDEIWACMPSPEEARQFELPAGVPVIVFQRIAWTTDRVVCLARELQPADRNVLLYELGDISARDRAEERK